MGQIHSLKLSRSVGNASTSSELRLEIGVDELGGVVEALDGKFRPLPPAADDETCDVPRANLETEPEPEPEARNQLWSRWKERAENVENHLRVAHTDLDHMRQLLDAARGAAVLLAGALGMDEPGAVMPIHTILKQANARVTGLNDQAIAMDAEMSNLLNAMSRFGLPAVDGINPETQSIPRQMQSVAHHFDVLKRQGRGVNGGLEVESLPRTREQLMEVMGKLQQDAMGAVIDVALIDGFITKDMDPKQATAGAMRWAAAEDARRKSEVDAKEPAAVVPMTATEAAAAARARQNPPSSPFPTNELTAALLAQYSDGKRVDGGE